MNKIIAIICSVAISATFVAEASTVADADSAYTRDDFLTAAMLYEQANEELGPLAERYYNAGNAYYRAGQLGRAILNYERALRLDPTNKDIADNLEFVNAKTTDRIEGVQSVVGSATDSLAGAGSSNTWAWACVALFLLTLGGVACYIYASSVPLRKIGFFGAGITLVLTVVAGCLAWRTMKKATATDEAVIVTPSVMLSTTPRAPKDRSEEAMLLHEGSKVYLVDSLTTDSGKWYDVKVNGSNRAWLPAEAVAVI